MDIRPVDLPELRAELVDHTREVTPSKISAGARATGGAPPSKDWVEFHCREYAREAEALERAELFHVSAQMTSLAMAAAESLPPFTLLPEDIPASSGLMYFGRPFTLDGAQEKWPTWAASWRTTDQGINVTWYGETSLLADVASESVNEFLATALKQSPRLSPNSTSQAPYGGDGEYGESHKGVPYNAARQSWLNKLKAMWLLMQQPLARVTEIEPDRAARKRLRRAGHEVRAVRVIELRRPQHSGSGDGSREFHHQWIVRGHWRQQWYPAREVHRPVWIAPHIKGPEGAPLIGGEKVYAWKR